MAHRRRWVTALVAVGLSTAAAGLPAQQGSLRLARNTIFAEVSTLLAVGNASVNYERKINEMLSARVGVGMGYMCCLWEGDGIGAGGVLGMLHFSTRREHKFEAGLGVSFVTTEPHRPVARAYPSFTLGYRYQRAQGGFVFRVGANWTYLYGIPYQMSFGYAF